jgi:hypothetical protein
VFGWLEGRQLAESIASGFVLQHFSAVVLLSERLAKRGGKFGKEKAGAEAPALERTGGLAARRIGQYR